MKCFVFDATGTKLLRKIEGVPECGVDFCDQCGDCLDCSGSDECYYAGVEQGGHHWVVYEGDGMGPKAPDARNGKRNSATTRRHPGGGR